MTVESSEPLIFHTISSNEPEALALREYRKRKESTYARILNAAAGFFEGSGIGVPQVGALIFWAFGLLIGISGATLAINPDTLAVSVNLRPGPLITAGVLFLAPFLVYWLSELQLKPGTKIYGDFRELVRQQSAPELKGWLSTHGLSISERRIPGVQRGELEDLAFYLALGETIPNGEIGFIGAAGERLRGSFEPLPDGGYALLLTEVNRPAERTDHA